MFWAFWKSRIVSAEKLEKVVKPPHNPIMKNERKE